MECDLRERFIVERPGNKELVLRLGGGTLNHQHINTLVH